MISRFDHIKNINLDVLLKEGAHIVLFGMTGSGKTTLLLWLVREYYQLGGRNTVIWRDSNTLESFSLLKTRGGLGEIPIKAFIPEGCKIDIEHEYLEKYYFDPKNFHKLFEEFSPESLNVILFDFFCFEDDVRLRFWANFFYELWKWKRATMKRIKIPFHLIVDEFSFICPGDRRHQIKGQSRLSNNIYQSMATFRKWNIRLVASAHFPNDIHYGTRQQFSFKIYKRISRPAVPNEHWMYAHHFPKLRVYEAIVFDENDDFNRINRTPFFIEPEKIVFSSSGEVKREQVLDEELTPRKAAKKWRERAIRYAKEMDKDYKDVADDWDIDNSYAWKLMKEEEGPPEDDDIETETIVV